VIYNKYGNKKVSRVLGKKIVEFDSIKEAKRFDYLYILLSSGKISDLVTQPEYLLSEAIRHNGKTFKSVKYIADFRYIEDGKTVVEDVKGFKTDVYSVKVKWFLSIYGKEISFQEI
jgi:hypothetical protein